MKALKVKLCHVSKLISFFRRNCGFCGAEECEDDRESAVVQGRRAEPEEGGVAAAHRGDEEEATKRGWILSELHNFIKIYLFKAMYEY